MHSQYTRHNNRQYNQLRDISFQINYLKDAEGSCLVKMGNTWVLCAASIDEKVPPFLRNTGSGWVTAEYAMLPRSTNTRNQREVTKGHVSGRTQEIQRLIGRCLRTCVDLTVLGERQIIVDCDVIQADGGTRTAAINGGFIALHLALQKLIQRRILRKSPIIRQIAAISCGLVNNNILLDLDFVEDSGAQADANFVFSDSADIIELQATAEKGVIPQAIWDEMLLMGKAGCQEIIAKQKAILLDL